MVVRLALDISAAYEHERYIAGRSQDQNKKIERA